MVRASSILFCLILLSSSSFAQENKPSLVLGCNLGSEKIVIIHPKRRSDNVTKSSYFTIGIVESIKFIRTELFIGQYYTSENLEYESANSQGTISFNYHSSHIVIPIGIDLRLSKSNNRYLFLSGGYRLDLTFNQKKIDGKFITQRENLIIGRQNFELGFGFKYKLSNSLAMQYRASYVFKPFEMGELLVDFVSDSRIRNVVGLSKIF